MQSAEAAEKVVFSKNEKKNHQEIKFLMIFMLLFILFISYLGALKSISASNWNVNSKLDKKGSVAKSETQKQHLCPTVTLSRYSQCSENGHFWTLKKNRLYYDLFFFISV